MNRISTCFASLLLSCALTAQAQQYQLNSPDGKLIVNIEAGQALNWAIAHDGTTVLLPSDIAMQCTESEGKPIAFTFGKGNRAQLAEQEQKEKNNNIQKHN